MITEAIILAGGRGTRLQTIVQDIPKPMAWIRGKPFLYYLLDYVQFSGIQRIIILSVGYKYEVIQSYFSDRYRGAELLYSIEDKPYGTGGAIRKALEMVTCDEVLVLNGDSLFEIDLAGFYTFHQSRQSLLSIALRFQQETGRYGLVETDAQQRITGFREKEPESKGGWINGGIYLINTLFYLKCSKGQRFSLEKDLLPHCIHVHPLFGYPAEGFFIDIGTPESYWRAQDEFTRFENR